MPNNSFSTSRDLTLTLVTDTGVLNFDLTTDFTTAPITEDFVSKGIDGVNRFESLERGWRGRFSVLRTSGALDQYFAQKEKNYYLGKSGWASITETIMEADQSVSQYRYTGVVLKLESAGSWSGSSTVRQEVSFLANRRLQVAP